MKKLFFLCIVIFVASFAFAEPACINLTDSDVANFAKNYSAIMNAMYSSPSSDMADRILEKNGISGPNRNKKFDILGYGVSAVVTESQIDEQTAKRMKAMGVDPFAQLTKGINSQDYAVIKKHAKEIVAAQKDYVPAPVNPESIYKIEQGEGSKYLSQAKDKILSAKNKSDCGLLYKKCDSKNAASYAKQNKPPVDAFIAYKEWTTEAGKTDALLSVSPGRITFRYYDTEGEEVEDYIELSRESEEFYKFNKSGEYVLKTKEAGTIHVWFSDSHNGVDQKVKVWIEGLGELDFGEFVYVAG